MMYSIVDDWLSNFKADTFEDKLVYNCNIIFIFFLNNRRIY